jgi:hypothetical protein
VGIVALAMCAVPAEAGIFGSRRANVVVVQQRRPVFVQQRAAFVVPHRQSFVAPAAIIVPHHGPQAILIAPH